ncbi:MAG: XdhC family protein [Bacillota bacterium]
MTRRSALDTIALLERAVELARLGRAFAIVTVVEARGSAPRHEGAKMLVVEDGTTCGTVGGGKLEALATQQALECVGSGQNRLLELSLTEAEGGIGTACGGVAKLFVEVVVPQSRLLVFGAGHVGRALAKVAAACGMKVVVYDDRPDKLAECSGPNVTTVCGELENVQQGMARAGISIGANDKAVVVTRGHAHDAMVLYQLLSLPFRLSYVGMIGSREKVGKCFQELQGRGIPDEALKGVKSPIGLDIGAETPEEIAVSVLAEVIAFSKIAQGKCLKFGPLSAGG